MAEEIGPRGYVIERIESYSGSSTLAVGLSVLGSGLIHLRGWGVRYALEIMPGETLYALLYLWRRNVSVCATAHAVDDAFSMVVWPMLPEGVKAVFWRTLTVLF